MRKLTIAIVLFIGFIFSGCTMVQFTYIRNLTPDKVEIYFDFDVVAMKSMPDSVHVPYSPTSHPIGKSTVSFMTDSIAAKRYSSATMHISLPAGGMIMFDKTTSRKLGYMAPEKIKVGVPGKEAYTVRLSGDLQDGEKQFQQKGSSPKIYWHDIY